MDSASSTSTRKHSTFPADVSAPDPCAGGCSCRGDAKPTVSDYIDRGLRRLRGAPLPLAGEMRHDDAGRYARFSLRVEDGEITQITFEASTCVTLVAYCEVLAEWMTGLTIRAAVRRTQLVDLLDELPLVPLAKRGGALLAVEAAMVALVSAAREEEA